MSNIITLDQIIAASKASGVSIADIIVGIDRAQSPAQTTPRKPVAKKAVSDKKAAMAELVASPGQFGRINRKHAALGLRTYRTLAQFREVFPTMLDASDYYASI